VPEVYHSGTQGYTYWGPAVGYKNVSFQAPDPGLEIVEEEFREYYTGNYSGMYSEAAAHYLSWIWGGNAEVQNYTLPQIIAEIKERPLILNVWHIWYDKEGKKHKSGHYVVLTGYEDRGKPGFDEADIFCVNDPVQEVPSVWSYEEFLERREGKPKAIIFIPALDEEKRKYTVVVDNHYVRLDNIGAKSELEINCKGEKIEEAENYVWCEYYGPGSYRGDWYYPLEEGHWAKWKPDLPTEGDYEIHVIFRRDDKQDKVTYRVHDIYGNDTEITIDQRGSGWADISLGTFPLGKDSYVQVDNVCKECNVDAMRFEYIGPIPVTLPRFAVTDPHYDDIGSILTSLGYEFDGGFDDSVIRSEVKKLVVLR
jgi:hypothetical protein